jgi:hypothetical protein
MRSFSMSSGAIPSHLDLRLIVQNDTQQGTVDLDVAVVIVAT